MALTTRHPNRVRYAIKDSDVYPVGTVIRIKRSNEFAIIRTHTFQHLGKGFLNYLIEVECKEGLYCAYHDDIELEHLPVRTLK